MTTAASREFRQPAKSWRASNAGTDTSNAAQPGGVRVSGCLLVYFIAPTIFSTAMACLTTTPSTFSRTGFSSSDFATASSRPSARADNG